MTLLFLGWRTGELTLAKIGVLICLFSVLLLGLLLWIDVRQRRRQYGFIVRYSKGLRDYAVANIEPLRETVAALHDVSVPKPPSEVPTIRTEAEDRPLSTKERNTLLVIIAVLCKESKIDYAKAAKAAGAIQSLADAQGLRIGETTIEGHLKRVPDAIEARSR